MASNYVGAVCPGFSEWCQVMSLPLDDECDLMHLSVDDGRLIPRSPELLVLSNEDNTFIKAPPETWLIRCNLLSDWWIRLLFNYVFIQALVPLATGWHFNTRNLHTQIEFPRTSHPYINSSFI